MSGYLGTKAVLLSTTAATVTGSSTVGAGLTVDNDGATVLTVDRATSDGTIVDVQRGGSSVGGISSVVNSYIQVGSGNTGVVFNSGVDAIIPHNGSATRDAVTDLGLSSGRFKDLYLSGGVYLGGTGSANLLDDYEEGTWTPRYTAASGGDLGGTQQSLGRYTKIGRMVHVKIYIYINNISVSGKSGAVHISGLPFTVADVGASSANATSTTQSTGTFGAFATAPTHAAAEVGTTKIDLFKPLASQVENKLQVTDFATASGNRNYLRFDVTYETA